MCYKIRDNKISSKSEELKKGAWPPFLFSPLPRKSSKYCSLLTIHSSSFPIFLLNQFQSHLQPNHATESAPQNARSIVNQFSNIPLSWPLSPPWFNFFTWLPNTIHTWRSLYVLWLLLFWFLLHPHHWRKNCPSAQHLASSSHYLFTFSSSGIFPSLMAINTSLC